MELVTSRYNPCFECLNRRGHSYTSECDNTCDYACAVKLRDVNIEDLNTIIAKLEKMLSDASIHPTDDQTEEFDRHTALKVLQDLSTHMYPSLDLYGNKTLVIGRYKFEAVRAKYLDKKKE